MSPPSAIFSHPDQIEGVGKDLVGRQTAGPGFLQGWLGHAGGDKVRVATNASRHGKVLD